MFSVIISTAFLGVFIAVLVDLFHFLMEVFFKS